MRPRVSARSARVRAPPPGPALLVAAHAPTPGTACRDRATMGERGEDAGRARRNAACRPGPAVHGRLLAGIAAQCRSAGAQASALEHRRVSCAIAARALAVPKAVTMHQGRCHWAADRTGYPVEHPLACPT